MTVGAANWNCLVFALLANNASSQILHIRYVTCLPMVPQWQCDSQVCMTAFSCQQQ